MKVEPGMRTWNKDLPASLVLLLVALPLCMGVAIASGMPPDAGLMTGIIGGTFGGVVSSSRCQGGGRAVR